MKRNNNILEEDNVLISEWDSETTDNTCQDIEKLGGTVELMSFMNECEEAFINSLSNHLSSWHKFRI